MRGQFRHNPFKVTIVSEQLDIKFCFVFSFTIDERKIMTRGMGLRLHALNLAFDPNTARKHLLESTFKSDRKLGNGKGGNAVEKFRFLCHTRPV